MVVLQIVYCSSQKGIKQLLLWMHVYLHPTLNLLLGQKTLKDPSLNNKEIKICQNSCILVQKILHGVTQSYHLGSWFEEEQGVS